MGRLNEREIEARKRLCLALDGLATLAELRDLVEELSPWVGLFKVGKESFTRFGPEAVSTVRGSGAEVFLDLKYHDIPNTVRGAAEAAAELGVSLFDVHASGGSEMMKAAVEGARRAAAARGERAPGVVAVTVLTSLDQDLLDRELGMPGSLEERVRRLARLARGAGCDGIVCSASELRALKGEFPADFLFVTPGIAGPRTPAGPDQKRVCAPGQAVRDGASILVVGRAITAARDRARAAREVLRDMTA